MRKLTTQEFIEKAKKIHGDKYNYSKVEYIKSRLKVCIICPEHGEFWQQASSHLQGQGCPECNSRNKPITKEYFIQQAIKVHRNIYDYSKVPDFPSSHIPVPIICPKHGTFMQSTYSHRTGQKCPKCAREINAYNQAYKWEELKDIFEQRHNNKYDYSQVDYINMSTPIKIICHKHGAFMQKPRDHIRYAGCPRCNSSKGELYVESILRDLNVQYQRQYPIKYANTTIHSDFLVKYNNSTYIIEYNGKQHYIPIKHFGGELKFKKQLDRDNYLKQYCEDNGIILLSIPYYLNNDEIKELIINTFKENAISMRNQ